MYFVGLFVFIILFVSYLTSFYAEMFWLFELFSHFLMQYALIGLVLGGLFAYLKKPTVCVLSFCIAIAAFVQTRMPLQDPMVFSDPANNASMVEEYPVTFVQYNQNVSNVDFTNLRYLIGQGNSQYDVVVIQEANQETVKLADSLKAIYPYQILQPRENPFGMVILSRYPISHEEMFTLGEGEAYENILIRFRVRVKDAGNVINVYAFHPPPPVSAQWARLRNEELSAVAQEIAKDKMENVVMIGDFNLTPYSPHFKNLLSHSGLKYQASGLFQDATWPSKFTFAPFQIPIDHVLFSSEMRFLSKGVVSSHTSDHGILVTQLGIKRYQE